MFGLRGERVGVLLLLAAPGLGFQPMRRTAARVVQQNAEGDVKYNSNSDWKPKDTGGMQSTDTPDFFYEDGENDQPEIKFTDGIMGTTGLDKMKEERSHDPGVANALKVDPTITAKYEAASAESKGVKFELDPLAKMGRFEAELELSCAAGSDNGVTGIVSIKPVCMAYEDFYAGWSPESSPCLSVSPTEGRMERRGGEPSDFEITLKPDGKPGEKVGYLCVLLPEENEQFTVKVTATLF